MMKERPALKFVSRGGNSSRELVSVVNSVHLNQDKSHKQLTQHNMMTKEDEREKEKRITEQITETDKRKMV